MQYPLSSYSVEVSYDPEVLEYIGFDQSALHNSAVVNPAQPGRVNVVAIGRHASATDGDITGRDVLLGTMRFNVVGGPGEHPGALSGRAVEFTNVGTYSWVWNQPIGVHDGQGGYVDSLTLNII